MREWSPFFAEQHPHPHIALFRQLANSPHAIHQPIMGIWQEYLREVNTMMDVVGLLVKPPEAALADCQRRIGESWAWHRENAEPNTPDEATHAPTHVHARVGVTELPEPTRRRAVASPDGGERRGLLPVVVLYFLARKTFIAGIATTGIKG